MSRETMPTPTYLEQPDGSFTINPDLEQYLKAEGTVEAMLMLGSIKMNTKLMRKD